MNGLSVVIPSKNAGNLTACVRAIQQTADDFYEIIVIDDGIEWWNVPQSIIDDLSVIPGDSPFVFSGNVSLGMMMADPRDVFLLNDDALLTTRAGLEHLRDQVLVERANGTEYGIIAAACTNVGNPNQWPGGDPAYLFAGWKARPGITPEPRMVCFTAVYISRSTINEVGLLDQRFVGYGFEDDDYCLRVRKAGLKIGIFDGCVVDHHTLKSSYREGQPEENRERFMVNKALFETKWGAGNMEL